MLIPKYIAHVCQIWEHCAPLFWEGAMSGRSQPAGMKGCLARHFAGTCCAYLGAAYWGLGGGSLKNAPELDYSIL